MTINNRRHRTRSSSMTTRQLDDITALAQTNIRKARRTVSGEPPGTVVIEVNHTLSHRNQGKR
jgi:hypothetical protein